MKEYLISLGGYNSFYAKSNLPYEDFVTKCLEDHNTRQFIQYHIYSCSIGCDNCTCKKISFEDIPNDQARKYFEEYILNVNPIGWRYID